MSNWHEDPRQAMSDAVAAYMTEASMFDAVIAIRNDFYRDPNKWAESMVRCGYDGFVHHLGLGVSHLMVYNPDVIQIVSEESYASLAAEDPGERLRLSDD